MSLKQLNNLRESELNARISRFVEIDKVISGTFRCVLSRYNNDWSMLMGVVTLESTETANEKLTGWLKYPNYQFICTPIQDVTPLALIEIITNNCSIPIPGLPKLCNRSNNLHWTESLIPSHASNGALPLRRFSANICSNVNLIDEKLIAHGLDFHMSAFDYVSEFLHLDKFHGHSDGRKGDLHIDIPDKRGTILFTDNGVKFQCGTTDKLSVVGAIDGEPVNLASPNDTLPFEADKVSNMELWLVNESDEIIDYRSSSEWQYRYGIQTNRKDPTKLLQIISNGESEHCEFKKYIDLEQPKNKKSWELDKTVCALSNHQGGKLFIGVDDDTSIVGINDGCQKSYKCDVKDGAIHYMKAVTKRLQESLSKNQCFNSYLIEHNHLIVLVIEVHKANGLNYLLERNEAYIRRGASSRQMTPSEIQAFPPETDVLGRNLFASTPFVN